MIEGLLQELREVRKEDYFLYEQIEMLPSIKKMHLLENVLTINYTEGMAFDVLATKCLVGCLEEASQKYFSEDLTVDLSDYAEEIFTDTMTMFVETYGPLQRELADNLKLSLLQESGNADEPGVWDKIKNFPKDVANNFMSFAVRKLPIASVLAAISNVALPIFTSHSGFGMAFSIWALVIAIFWTLFFHKLHKDNLFNVNIWKENLQFVKDIADLFHKFGKMLQKSTAGIKYRFMVTFENEEKCYTRAGLSEKDMGFGKFMGVKKGSIWRHIMLETTPEKLDILRNCYLENYLDRVSIFFEMYFQCLRSSGNWASVKEYSDDKFIQMMRMKGKMFPVCEDHQKNALEAIKQYEKLIGFFFEDDADEKSKWLLLLNRYILDQREPKDRQIEKHRSTYMSSKRTPFTSDKYKKMGKNL